MPLHTFWVAALIVLLFLSSQLAAENALKPGTMYDYPVAQEEHGFKPHELPFVLPKDGIARAEFLSEPFYAIILKSAKECSISESERASVQAFFPNNKVFVDRFQCDDFDSLEEYISYRNTNPDYSFLAVFGGLRRDEAEDLISQMQLGSKFPGANIRKMQVVLNYP